MPVAAALVALLGIATPARGALVGEVRDTWTAYKTVYVSADGRVIDYRADATTTSEGQAYALVRALWMNDRPAFDLVLHWTVDNLQGGDAGRLPAWKWGKGDDGTWGVRDPQPAADADQLYAWALLGASKRWKEPRYAAMADALIRRVWEDEVSEVAGHLVLLPGPWARGQVPTRLNPSYFLPFVWRDFARVDPVHPWMRLLDDGYAVLAECRSPLGLPKDWCYLDADGVVVPPEDATQDNFAFEAFRTGWTLAAEVKWHHERRARALLAPYVSLLSRPAQPVRIPGVIQPDGSGAVDWEYPGMYGALLPAWGIRRPAAARRAWTEKLAPLRAEHGWGDPNDYYGQNWIWFGLALWQLKEMPA